METERSDWSYTVIQICIFFICAGRAFGQSYTFLFLKERGLSLLELGMIGSLSSVSSVSMRIPIGWLADKTGQRKHYVSTALAAMALLLFIYPTVVSFGGFLILNVLTAVVSLFHSGPVYNALLMDVIGNVEAGRRIGRYRIWGSVSWIVLQPVAGFLAQRFGLSVLYPIGGLLFAVAALTSILITAPRRHVDARKSDGPPGSLKGLLTQRDLVILTLTQTLSGFVHNVRGFLDIYLLQIGASISVIGLVKGLWIIPEVPSLLFFPRLSDRIGRWPIIALALTAHACTLVTFGVSSNLYVLFVTQLLSTFFTFSSTMITTVYLSELTPREYRSSVFSITSTTTNAAGVPGQYFAGYLGEVFGLSSMYLIEGAIALIPATFFTVTNTMISLRRRGRATHLHSTMGEP